MKPVVALGSCRRANTAHRFHSADGKPVPEPMSRARPVELALHVIAFRPAKPGPPGVRIRRSCRVEAEGSHDPNQVADEIPVVEVVPQKDLERQARPSGSGLEARA